MRAVEVVCDPVAAPHNRVAVRKDERHIQLKPGQGLEKALIPLECKRLPQLEVAEEQPLDAHCAHALQALVQTLFVR